VRGALATPLFRDGKLSRKGVAHVAEMDVCSFTNHLRRPVIPAIRLTAAEIHTDLNMSEQWLQSSSPTPAP
jgi:hypothetical protein